jgi:hypothetical protein
MGHPFPLFLSQGAQGFILKKMKGVNIVNIDEYKWIYGRLL